MAQCEDFPCCGHEPGCCPDFDEDGRQLNMVCVCGAKVPITNRYSICDGCMRTGSDDDCDFAADSEARSDAEADRHYEDSVYGDMDYDE